MTNHINGQILLELFDFGLKNLTAHKDRINSLNVFPVPDGDTGTNMILTLQSGLEAAEKEGGSLSACADSFARAIVFGARGNSGVILSQFLRGFCETLSSSELADSRLISRALDAGVELAYSAVSNPVEGTMLTVLRETALAVSDGLEREGVLAIEPLFELMLASSRESLARTPELLPILRSASVVDSGGEGIVRIFEGMCKYLAGEELSDVEEPAAPEGASVDYSRFNPDSTFDYGYCTELLVQFTKGKKPFDQREFNLGLEELGDSIVTACRGDKLKVHVHSFVPEKVLAFCHGYGEFLSLKIENMSVQHDSRPTESAPEFRGGPFGVAVLAHTPDMAERFSSLGADIVIRAERGCPPAAADFIAAFEKLPAPHIFVFPNSKNAVPVAKQAAELYEKAGVTVFETVSDPQCYAALPMIDFSQEDPAVTEETVSEAIGETVTVTVTRASRGVTLDGRRVEENDFAAMSGSRLLGVGSSPADAACMVPETLGRDYSVVRIFADTSVSEDELSRLTSAVTGGDPFIETEIISANDGVCPIILLFE